ncbi:hypothetical protein E2C01_000757 [Portunus trituberculatus]|uniref:Uncharacterized protein n=1 Tax=Portunus trituberculatus TaxID=210409 RepID=A0A5B7CHF5_PORTR|nr:hypothetical protein [Portunus trituberculatus]
MVGLDPRESEQGTHMIHLVIIIVRPQREVRLTPARTEVKTSTYKNTTNNERTVRHRRSSDYVSDGTLRAIGLLVSRPGVEGEGEQPTRRSAQLSTSLTQDGDTQEI